MRKRLVAANWKMNLTIGESLRLVTQLDNHISASTKVEVVLCPSSVALAPLVDKLKPMKFKLGAQNVHYLDHGAFTGEVSATQLQGLAEYVIVGHSERRLHFGETNDVIARKVSAVVRNGMTPILCVGENLFERQDNETAQVLRDQLAAGLVMLTTREVAQIVVAYEPVWAVGTGEVAHPDHIKSAIRVIRHSIQHLYGHTVADQVRVLYGGSIGSVDSDLLSGYLRIKGLDGFLVGGASLNPYEFAAIVKAAQRTLGRKVLKRRTNLQT